MLGPLQTIVVGTATTTELDPVLPSALQLARASGGTLHIAHVVDVPASVRRAFPGGEDPTDPGHPFALWCAERCEASLREQVARFGGGSEVHFHFLLGAPHERLTTLAREVNADLLVIGDTRRGRMQRNQLGTTAERILRLSTVPTLVMHAPFFHGVQRVLLATDLSPYAAAVHEWGIDAVEGLFPRSEPELRTVLVVDAPPVLPPAIPQGLLTELAAGELGRFLAARRPRSRPASEVVRLGEPASEITREANAWNADLIVLGSHAHPDPAHAWLGRVVAATLRATTRNTLVIPARAPGVPARGERTELAAT